MNQSQTHERSTGLIQRLRNRQSGSLRGRSLLRLSALTAMALCLMLSITSCKLFSPRTPPAPARVPLVLAPPLSELCPQAVYVFAPGQQVTADQAALLAIAERQAHAACAARHAKTLEKIEQFNKGE